MTFEIKHAHQVDLIANPPDGVSVVQFDHWNAALVATMASGLLLGRASNGAGPVEELTVAQIKTLLAYGVADISGLQAALNSKQPSGDYALSSHSHSAATTSAAGFMSASDKAKLDGVASGAQVNAVTSVAGRTGAVTLAKGDVGLGNVDNTSDTNKPVSSAQLTALNGKAATDLSNVTQANARAKVGTGTMAYRNVTISTADPSGGADGDIWLKV